MQYSERQVCDCCGRYGAYRLPTNRDATKMECPQCGAFEISRSAVVSVMRFDSDARARLSAWIRQYQPSMFSSDQLDDVANARSPSLVSRAERMLRVLADRYPVGRAFSYYDLSSSYANVPSSIDQLANPLISAGWNRNDQEAIYVLERVLNDELHLLDRAQSPMGQGYIISPKGWIHLEQKPNEVSSIAFCAIWFHESMKHFYTDVIEPAIRDSGYEPLRIDNKEHTNKIDDEIVASIRSARFVVADYTAGDTGPRGGVYYEAGFAHGLGLPVIFMAREGTDLHFDIRQYNTIFWKTDNFADARERLKNRILATLGRGPLKTT